MKVAVLFPKIFNFPFTYESHIKTKLRPGDFVKAPFGSVELTGVIWP
jgi:primosomal protein N' (replication factor Y)